MDKKRIKRYIVLTFILCTFFAFSLTVSATESEIPETESPVEESVDETEEEETTKESTEELTEELPAETPVDNPVEEEPFTGGETDGGDSDNSADDGNGNLDDSDIDDSITNTEETFEDVVPPVVEGETTNGLLSSILSSLDGIAEVTTNTLPFMEKPLNEYTVSEGLLLLIFVILLLNLFINVTTKLLHWRMI